MDGDPIASFVGLTGASEETARGVLGLTGGDIEQAVSLYFDNPEIVASLNSGAGSSSSAPVLPPINATGSLRSERPRGPASHDNPIAISSDDDDEFPMTDNDGWGDEEAASVARNAQEEEDAAMARRLQEEMYGAGGPGADADPEGIRAPMARTTETLVAPSYGGLGMADDDEAEMQAAAMRAQLNRRRAQQRAQGNNPFAQASPWGPSGPTNGGPGPVSGPSAGQLRLAELFKPPFDLITHLPFDEARNEGREEKKWLLVNIQDLSVFSCQVLNRDIWKDERIRQLVQENFLFMQYTKDDVDAEQYIQYYMQGGRHENQDNYPHVSVVDPRTGEQVKVWSGDPFPSPTDFHAQLVEFLDRYSLDSKAKNPVAKTNPRKAVKDIYSMTEEEMLQMAMQKSLDAANGESVSGANVSDPDELTASVPDLGENSKGKEPAAADPAKEEGPPTSSPFASVASDKAHTEPANGPTTTRIQFRHPGGRVIRRFTAADSVQRIYEWLKSEPLEGKAGVEFELKAMPEGRDLIEDLGRTIEEAGLKNGTVMVEFIES